MDGDIELLRRIYERFNARDIDGVGKHPAPVAERTAQGREDVRRVGGNTAPICDDVVGPQSAKIAANRFNAIAHEAYDTISWLIRMRSPTD